MSNQESHYVYSIPLDAADISTVVMENASHVGTYEGSIDYAVPLGTMVMAAKDGVVSRVRHGSDQYGDNPSFGLAVNYITIDHGDEFSEYLHLEKGSSLVKCGEYVKTGQVLARTGLSGWMTAPHLHFMVYQLDNGNEGWRCRKIRFE